MKNLKRGIVLVLMYVTMISCSKDEFITAIITTNDLTVSVNENSAQGTVIGKITGESNIGTVTFSITNQSPNGSLSINATTGELTILDASVFDFETNPVITASIEVTDKTAKETADLTVNLNDLSEEIIKFHK